MKRIISVSIIVTVNLLFATVTLAADKPVKVFLLVGPATNVTTLLVVRRLLGGRSLGVYLGGIVLVALAAGLGVNAFYDGLDLDLSGMVAANLAEEPGPLGRAAAAVRVVLMAVSLVRIARARRAA